MGSSSPHRTIRRPTEGTNIIRLTAAPRRPSDLGVEKAPTPPRQRTSPREKDLPRQGALNSVNDHRYDLHHGLCRGPRGRRPSQHPRILPASTSASPTRWRWRARSGTHHRRAMVSIPRVVNEAIDPTFRSMTADWDGQNRMDPCSRFAMASLIAMNESFDLSFANDTDSDRHGIVTRARSCCLPITTSRSRTLICFRTALSGPRRPRSARLCVEPDHRSGRRGTWPKLSEMPVGFKVVRPRPPRRSLGFGGEESAGACSRAATAGLDHGQGRYHLRSACRGNHGKTGRDPSQLFTRY